MPNYRRAWHPGGTYFFTVNLLQRQDNDLLIRHVALLRNVVRTVRQHHPFRIHGWVVLPDHLHCIIELPKNEADFAVRWRLIKGAFSKGLSITEQRSEVRMARRTWHMAAPLLGALVRDEADFRAHMDYIHINPLKHGLVKQVSKWPYSTFHQLVEKGVYPADWAGGEEDKLEYED